MLQLPLKVRRFESSTACIIVDIVTERPTPVARAGCRGGLAKPRDL
jgi:hypothetical protein